MKLRVILARLKGSRLLSDSFWSLLGNIVSKGLSLAAGIIVARLLGKELFGEYGIIKNTLMTIAVFSSFGLGYTATKYIAEFRTKDQNIMAIILKLSFRITLIVSGVMAFCLFLFSGYVAETILSAPHLQNPLRILSVLIVFNALVTTQVGVLSGLGKFKETARINSITGIIVFISSTILTLLYGFDGALYALLICQVINWLLNKKLISTSIPKLSSFSTESNKDILKQILYFSFPVALQEGVYSLLQWVGSIILVTYASFGELGLFTAAMQWNAIILFVPGIMRNVILTHLSEHKNDEQRHSKVLQTTLFINVGMTLVPAILVYLFSAYINKLYGTSYERLDSLISVAVFATIFISISNVYSQAYMSKGMNWLMLCLRIVRDGGIIVAFFVLSQSFGFFGAEALIYSTLALNVIFSLIMFLFYSKFKDSGQLQHIVNGTDY